MKYFLFLIVVLDLYAINFRNLIVVSPQMSIDKIINIMESVKDYTVIRFRAGYYDFSYHKVMINNKISIAFEGVEGTNFHNLTLQVTNTNNMRINYIKYRNGVVRFLNDNNILIKNFTFEETNMVIDNSQIILYKVISKRDYNKKIVIHNSNINMGYSIILDNNSLVLDAIASNIGLFQNNLGLVRFITSNLKILENKFSYNSYLQKFFLIVINSNIDCIGNSFYDNYGGVLGINSKIHLERNIFINIKYDAYIEDNSEITLLKNKRHNGKVIIKDSIFLKDPTLLMVNFYSLRTIFDKAQFDIDYSKLKKVKYGN